MARAERAGQLNALSSLLDQFEVYKLTCRDA